MPVYKLYIPKRVFKQLSSIDSINRNHIRDEILKLRNDPYPAGKKVKKLKGFDGEYIRLRVGDYRIMFEVGEEMINILGIVHRRDLERWIKREQ